jgi:hypothetical protein
VRTGQYGQCLIRLPRDTLRTISYPVSVTTQGENMAAERGCGAAIYTPAHDDSRHEFEEGWDITAITHGYRAIRKDQTGPAAVALYGRTPPELTESIRMAEVSR